MKLYVDKQKLTEEMCNNLTATGITFHPYNNIYEDLKHLSSKETILLDPSRINYALRNCIPEGVSVVESENPSVLMKSVKNETELHNIEQAHIKDGVAVTRFMHWLKTHVGISSESPVTELSAADKLEEFRKEQDGYLWQSFEPICASATTQQLFTTAQPKIAMYQSRKMVSSLQTPAVGIWKAPQTLQEPLHLEMFHRI